ncbi:hypothetical protein H8B15_06405 [Hymenobacter sp. BT507]|uniref:Uncharacterized protein n=1 Tax=Hymenobacter citatus TaxID=2763506 RepID=A0ABR7MHK8_9BACT|nr:hypothetical protein [Hymenobacter citatus]MBC6610545.1 hypothetical protein [Hymenobacter citatus]
MKHIEIRDKVLTGSKLAIQRLLDRKKRENACVVVSQNGKVVQVAVTDLQYPTAS